MLVLVLACTVTLAGGFIVGALFGMTVARARRDARIAPHEALRRLYAGPEWSER